MNSYTSKQVGFGRAFANELLAALPTRPAAALIATGKVRLSHDPGFNPSPSSTIADLDANECNYSGYTAGGIAAVISAPINLSNNAQGVVMTALFLATSATPQVTDTAYGYWLDDGTNVVCYEKFANNQAAPFQNPGDFLDLTLELPVQLSQATI